MEQKDKDELKDELLKGVGDYIKDQLSEQFKDAVAKLQPAPAPVIVTPEKPKFTSFRDFMLSVRNFRMNRTLDERLTFITGTGQKTTGHMEIGDDSQGGFLVPEIYRAELLEIALETSVVRPRATVLPMTTDSLKIPYVNDTSHASSVYGGVIAYWTAEAAAKTASKPTFGQLELTPHKLAGLTYASNELLADSAIALEPMIRRMFGTAWGYYEDDAFINGTGAGQPLGILNCGCLKSVFRNTANRVHYEDIAEMYQSMLPASLPYSVWVIHPNVLAELIELGSGNAADASGKILIWQPDAKGAIQLTLLGRPVILTEKCQGLGTTGDIYFCDFRYYLIGDRQSITIDASTHVAFTTDETAWRFVVRVAGQCWPQTTLTTRYGGHTFSPFVVLNSATS
jgi:HK97 family phage major capsid protein